MNAAALDVLGCLPEPSRNLELESISMTTLLVFYVGASFLLMFAALPLLCEKVPPNPLYGFRVRATLENPNIWYAVNRYAARRLIFSGALIAVAAIVLFFAPGLSSDAYAWSCLGVTVIALGTTLLQSWRFLQRITPKR